MRIIVDRNPTVLSTTIGSLSVIGADYHCFTLEDAVREIAGEPVSKWKVENETAVPCGIYPVSMRWSNHFKALMPHVEDIPGFSQCMFHWGNKITDTDGCTIVGGRFQGVTVLDSVAAFIPLLEIIARAFYRDEIVQVQYRMRKPAGVILA